MEKEFEEFISKLSGYLNEDKIFIQDPIRAREMYNAISIAERLFEFCDVEVHDDPIQMGALILTVKGNDIVVRGQDEINEFKSIISKANNFEFYSLPNGKIKFAAVFQGVLKRL